MNVIQVATGVIPVPPSGAASVEEDIFRVTKYLNRLGCQTSIVDIRADTPRRRDSGITFHEVPNLALPERGLLMHLKTLAFGMLAALRVRGLVRRHEVDLIHTHSQSSAFFILLAKRAFGWKTPVIYHGHNPYVLMKVGFIDRIRNSFEPTVCRRSDAVVAQTEAIAHALGDKFGVNRSRVVVIPSGPDLEEVEEFVRANPIPTAGKSGEVIFYPSRVCPRKNQLTLVKAMPRILKSNPEAKLVFAGPTRDRIEDASYFDVIEEFVTQANLDRQVEFVGEVPKEKLFALYQQADLLVFPTLSETIGQVQLEAMAFGLPCILSNIPPLKEVVDFFPGCAITVDPLNVEEIANAVTELLQNRQKRLEIGASGKQLVESRFNARWTAEQILGLYQTLLSA